MENISGKDKTIYSRILGKLNLPDISEYKESNHTTVGVNLDLGDGKVHKKELT